MRTGVTPGEAVPDDAVLEAVAAEAGWMEDLLCRLVEAPTVLGDEEPGQVIMEESFADCGMEPRSVRLDADALRRAEGSSLFTWDLDGKRNVVADWPAGGSGGRSLIMNGHIDVVPPAAEELWTHPPFRAARASYLGFNAIDAAVEVLAALRRHEAHLNEDPPPYDAFEHPINLNPGVISGGDLGAGDRRCSAAGPTDTRRRQLQRPDHGPHRRAHRHDDGRFAHHPLRGRRPETQPPGGLRTHRRRRERRGVAKMWARRGTGLG